MYSLVMIDINFSIIVSNENASFLFTNPSLVSKGLRVTSGEAFTEALLPKDEAVASFGFRECACAWT